MFRGTVTFWYRSGCGSVPNSLVTFRLQTKSFFHIFNVSIRKFKKFKIVKICLMIKIFCEEIFGFKFFLQPLFQSAQNFYQKKGKDPEPDPSYPDAYPGGLKTYGSYGFESGSGTLVLTLLSAVKQISGIKHACFFCQEREPVSPEPRLPSPRPHQPPIHRTLHCQVSFHRKISRRHGILF